MLVERKFLVFLIVHDISCLCVVYWEQREKTRSKVDYSVVCQSMPPLLQRSFWCLRMLSAEICER